MLNKVFVSAILLILFCSFAVSLRVYDGGHEFMIVSYNVENLFDTINDPNTLDDEFTPDGSRKWNGYRYNNKLDKIWKVISATDLSEFPDVVGLCEIENRSVLEDLIKKTPLRKAGYKILHKDSPDRRGIDVALLYRDETFVLCDSAWKKVAIDGDSSFITREILYAKGIVNSTKDTLHIFVNHWPSRYGGMMETEGYRCRAAQVLKTATDSVFNNETNAKIVCIGDFNDTPYNRSVNECLSAYNNLDTIIERSLYNVSYYLADKKGLWSYRYRGQGNFLDQVIVSSSLLKKNDALYILPDDVYPLQENFLLNNDGTIFRTYLDPKYVGGYSDHLPVVIKFCR